MGQRWWSHGVSELPGSAAFSAPLARQGDLVGIAMISHRTTVNSAAASAPMEKSSTARGPGSTLPALSFSVLPGRLVWSGLLVQNMAPSAVAANTVNREEG